MRVKSVLLAILPLANGLSLANFQEITSSLIPLSCQLQYDSQIQTCTVSDFEAGCSTGCKSALKFIAENVQDACSDVSVSSNTLLGIVKNGGIIAALCPSVAQGATSSEVNSVTIPTASPGVVVTTSKTSETSSTEQHATTTTSSQSTSTQTTEASQSTANAGSTSSTDTGPGITSSTSTKKTEATTTSKKASTTTASQKASDKSDSGGGSPFDVSNSGSAIGGALVFTYMIAACVSFMLRM